MCCSALWLSACLALSRFSFPGVPCYFFPASRRSVWLHSRRPGVPCYPVPGVPAFRVTLFPASRRSVLLCSRRPGVPCYSVPGVPAFRVTLFPASRRSVLLCSRRPGVPCYSVPGVPCYSVCSVPGVPVFRLTPAWLFSRRPGVRVTTFDSVPGVPALRVTPLGCFPSVLPHLNAFLGFPFVLFVVGFWLFSVSGLWLLVLCRHWVCLGYSTDPLVLLELEVRFGISGKASGWS